MPDLTTAIGAAVEAKCIDTAAKASAAAGKSIAAFDALKHENTERWVTGITHHTGFSADNRPQFTTDPSIGAMHWVDKAGVMQPINTDWTVGGDGWSDANETSQARILVDAKGTRRIYPDQNADAYIEFAPPEYYDGDKWQPLEVPEVASAKAVAAEMATWSSDHWRVEVTNTGSQSKLSYVMLDEKAPSRVRWPYACSGCSLDEAGNLTGEKGDVIAAVYQGRAEDADGAEVGVKTLFEKEAVEYTVDLGKAAWPVTLDPTVNYQVGATGNDGRIDSYTTEGSGGSFMGTSTYIGRMGTLGYYNAIFVRFTGVTISSGATVDVSYLSFKCKSYGYNANVTCKAKIQANDTATPLAPTTTAEYWALVRTTAIVTSTIGAWSTDSWYNSDSTNSIWTELLASYDYSAGLNAQFMVLDNGSSATAARRAYDYTDNASSGAALHIEYTAAATGFKHFTALLGVGR